MTKKYYSSGELLEEVRKLDYKQQYKLCYVFYDEIIKYSQFDENKFRLKFDEIYESINPDWIDEEIEKIQQCVEVMLDALSDVEMNESATFQKIVARIIKM